MQLNAPLSVHAQVAVPQIVVLVFDLRDVVEGPRVVDQDIDGPEVLLDGGEDFAHLLAIGDVHLHRGRPASHLPDLLARLLRIDDVLRGEELRERRVCFLGGVLEVRVRLDEDIGNDDVRPRPSELEAVRPPETTRSPGNDGDLTGQIEHATLLERLVTARSESLALGP